MKNKNYLNDFYNLIYKQVAGLLFVKENLKEHDTYKVINTITYFLEDELLPYYEKDNDELIRFMIDDMANLVMKLINQNEKISSDKKYVETHKKFVKECFLKTTQMSDFIIFPNGDLVMCSDSVSHDMAIALYIVDNNWTHYNHLLPEDFDRNSPVVLDREKTDIANILRFHVNPMKDGFIYANHLTTSMNSSQRNKLLKNYLYSECIEKIK